MTIECPLCGFDKLYILESYEVSLLKQEWLREFGVDTFGEINRQNDRLNHCQCLNCSLEFYDPIIVGNSNFYEHLSKNHWYYEEKKWEFDRAIQHLQKHKNIKTLLEIGCGRGYFLSKVSNAYESTGIELNKNAIAFCKEKKLNVVERQLETLNTKFDSIVMFEVLEHVDHPKEILDKIYDLLNDDGILIIAVPNPESYLREFDRVLLDMPPHHVTRWGKATFEHVAKHYNLKIISMDDEPLRYSHYQNYMSMLESKYHFIAKKTLKQNILQKLQKVFSLGSRNMRSKMLAQGYEFHKQNILGQTHLIVFKK
jgi:2-polyprenyl-3-methyl-5-hydroxy-6-metoxy-1,4-benzoquinol methylase